MITEVLNDINWLAVFAGALGYFLLGAICYPFLFKHKWVTLNKIDMNDPNGKKGVGVIMFTSFIMMFITSVAIAFLAYRIGMWGLMSGLNSVY
jgi:hypothetical protein